MIDEGYIKFDCDWTYAEALPDGQTEALCRWRQKLYTAGLIGFYPDLGVGFGNLSVRRPDTGQVIITGTQTGHLPKLSSANFTVLTDHDLATNRVCCRGPSKASSESLTHLAIYALNPGIQAVAHVHHKVLWEQLSGQIPTTAKQVAYGTPEMATEFQRLYRESDLPDKRLAVMAGHAEGLMSFGATLDEAGERLLALL